MLRENLTSSGEDLGKALGYGLLYSGQDNKEFVRETISSALSTVAEKQGVRKAFLTLLKDNIYNEYVNSMRVPDWIQLGLTYEQSAVKLVVRVLKSGPVLYKTHAHTVQPKNNARAITSFCVRKAGTSCGYLRDTCA